MTETNYGFEDLDNVCRLCLSTTTLVSIFDERFKSTEDWSMREVVEVTTGVKISPNDEVSHKLCNKCSHLIIRIFKFRNASMLNDMELKEKVSKRNMHKSVKDLLKQDPKLIVPSSICRCDMSPVVMLDRNVSHHLKTVKINPLKRRKSRDKHMKMIPSKDENVPKKSAMELGSSLANGTVQQSPKDPLGNVTAEKLSPPHPSLNDPVDETVRQQVDQKPEDGDIKSPLFTIKTLTKSIFICDFCNKVHYNTKELKKHRATHMRCSVCRSSFTSMEETKKHEHFCSVKKIISNQPRLHIERCDEIKYFREKYSQAFRNLIIEISDDESEPTSSKIPVKLKLIENVQRISMNIVPSVNPESTDHNSDGQNEISDLEKFKKESVIRKRISDSERSERIPHLEKFGKLFNLLNSKGSETSKGKSILETSEIISHDETNQNPEKSNFEEFKETKQPETFKGKSNTENSKIIPQMQNVYNPEESNVEKSENTKGKSNLESKIFTHLENILNREKSNVDKLKEIKEPETSKGKSVAENTKLISQMENMLNTEKSDIEGSEEKGLDPTQGILESSLMILKNIHHLEKSNVEESKENEPDTSEQTFNPKNSKSISLEESEKLISPKNASMEKSKEITCIKESEESKPYSFKTVSNREPEKPCIPDIPNVKKSLVVENSQSSEAESNLVKSNIEQSKEIKGPGKSKGKCNSENLESADKLPNSEMKSNPEGSSTVSSLGKTEKVLVLERNADKSEGIKNSKKYKEPSNPEIKELSINLKRICTSSITTEVPHTEISDEVLNKSNESPIHIKMLKTSENSKQVDKAENVTKKRKKKKSGRKEDHSKKLKRVAANETLSGVALNHENKNDLTMEIDNKSTTNINSFKPDISLGKIDSLEVEDVDDDNTYLKNLLQRIKKSEGQVEKSVQTSLPSNSDILNVEGYAFLYDLKNLRGYLNFTQIPVNISYAKVPSIKYTYEPSSLKRSQEKLKILKSKETTSSVRNRKIILIHPKHNKQTKKQSESSSAIKEVGIESSGVATKQTLFESNFRIESVMTVPAKQTATKSNDKINENVHNNENIQVYSTNTHPNNATTVSAKHTATKIDDKINTNVQPTENTPVYCATTNPNSVTTDTIAINIETPNQESNRFNSPPTSNCFPGNEDFHNTIVDPKLINIGNSVVSNNTTIPFISYSMNNIPVQNSLTTPTQYYLINNSVPNVMVSHPMTMITSAPAHLSNAQTFDANNQNMYSNINSSVSLPNTGLTPNPTARLPPPLRQILFKPPLPTSRQTSLTGAPLLQSRVITEILPGIRSQVTPSVPQSIRAHVIPHSPATVSHASLNNPSKPEFIAPRAPPLNRMHSASSKIRIVPRIPGVNTTRLTYNETTKDRSNCDILEKNKKKDEAPIQNEYSNHAIPVSSDTQKYIRVKNLAELK